MSGGARTRLGDRQVSALLGVVVTLLGGPFSLRRPYSSKSSSPRRRVTSRRPVRRTRRSGAPVGAEPDGPSTSATSSRPTAGAATSPNDASTGSSSGRIAASLRLHRDLLQPPAPTQRPRLEDTSELRTASGTSCSSLLNSHIPGEQKPGHVNLGTKPSTVQTAELPLICQLGLNVTQTVYLPLRAITFQTSASGGPPGEPERRPRG